MHPRKYIARGAFSAWFEEAGGLTGFIAPASRFYALMDVARRRC